MFRLWKKQQIYLYLICYIPNNLEVVIDLGLNLVWVCCDFLITVRGSWTTFVIRIGTFKL